MLMAWFHLINDDKLLTIPKLNVLLLGLGNIFWVPLANVFGRRPVLILSAMILFVATLCGGFTADFNLILIIRIFQGIGSSVSETIAPAIVGDMFFIHERAGWMVCSFFAATPFNMQTLSDIVYNLLTGTIHRLSSKWFRHRRNQRRLHRRPSRLVLHILRQRRPHRRRLPLHRIPRTRDTLRTRIALSPCPTPNPPKHALLAPPLPPSRPSSTALSQSRNPPLHAHDFAIPIPRVSPRRSRLIPNLVRDVLLGRRFIHNLNPPALLQTTAAPSPPSPSTTKQHQHATFHPPLLQTHNNHHQPHQPPPPNPPPTTTRGTPLHLPPLPPPRPVPRPPPLPIRQTLVHPPPARNLDRHAPIRRSGR